MSAGKVSPGDLEKAVREILGEKDNREIMGRIISARKKERNKGA